MTQETLIAEDSRFVKFPSTGQFRNTIQAVTRATRFKGLDSNGEAQFDHTRPLPALMFRGTVKLHGTNAAIVFHPDDGVHFQSRERILTQEADNAGFHAYMSQRYFDLGRMLKRVELGLGLEPNKHTITIFGEWCGGNIQKGVALSQLEKMFVFFLIKVDDQWFEPDFVASMHDARIYNILDFANWYLPIDFNYPEKVQARLSELTLQVEARCPVAAAFGVEGIGEGIVWRCSTRPSSDYWFKVKGEKHSASKVKTLAPVDVEKANSVMEFVQRTVTEARLEQARNHLVNELRKPMDPTSTGDFIRWVVGDIHKEEADTLKASGLDPKDVNGKISAAAKAWYFKELAEHPLD